MSPSEFGGLGAGASGLTQDYEKELTIALARRAVADVAPQELPIFGPTSRAYFEDPKRAAGQPSTAEDMLGFGAEVGLALTYLTPAALEVARSVAAYLSGEVIGALKEEAGPRIRALVRRLLGEGSPAEGAVTPKTDSETEEAAELLTREQLGRVREVALETARRLRLSDDRSTTLADAIVGSLTR